MKYDNVRIQDMTGPQLFEFHESLTYRGCGDWVSSLRSEWLDTESHAELMSCLGYEYLKIMRNKQEQGYCKKLA